MKVEKNRLHFYHLLLICSEENKQTIYSQSQLYESSIRRFIQEAIALKELSLNELDKLIELYQIDKSALALFNKNIEAIIYSSRFTIQELYGQLQFQSAEYKNSYEYFDSLSLKMQELKTNNYPSKYLIDNIRFHNNYFYSIIQSQNLKHYHSDYSLLYYFIFHNLSTAVAYITANQNFNTDISLLNNDLKNIDQIIVNYGIDLLEIKLFRLTVNLLLENSHVDYTSIISILRQREVQLEDDYLNDIFIAISNTLYINSESWGLEEIENLNLFKLKFQLYPSTFINYLTPQSVKNIATMSIRYDEIEWFEQVFNDEVIKKLHQRNQETLKLCRIKFSFHRGEYNECIEKLNSIKIGNIFQNLEVRRLQIMCFYELGERVLVDNYASTFNVFLYRNNDVSKMYKESNGNFLKIIIRLNKVIYKEKVLKLLEEIKNYKNLAERKWLLEKSNSLYNKLLEEK